MSKNTSLFYICCSYWVPYTNTNSCLKMFLKHYSFISLRPLTLLILQMCIRDSFSSGYQERFIDKTVFRRETGKQNNCSRQRIARTGEWNPSTLQWDQIYYNIRFDSRILANRTGGRISSVCGILIPVSYTHLDVYKRQIYSGALI